MKAIVLEKPEYLQHIPDKFKKILDFVLELVELKPWILIYISPDLKDDYNLIIKDSSDRGEIFFNSY